MDPHSSEQRARERIDRWQKRAIAVEHVGWIERAFASQEQAHALLLPELENGTLAYSDFNNALEFLPSLRQNRWRNGLYATAVGSVCGFLSLRSNPREVARFALVSGTSSISYYIYKEIERHRSYAQFLLSLEDRDGFNRALRQIRRNSLGLPRSDGQEDQISWPASSDSNGDIQTSPPSKPPLSDQSSSPPKSRWEHIRAANARPTAQGSSWEALRQHHERSRMQKSSEPQSANDHGAE